MSRNTYDKYDLIKQVSMLRAGPVTFAAYRVRDLQTMKWSSLQFHLTCDNTVMAVMDEDAAKLFVTLVTRTLANQAVPAEVSIAHFDELVGDIDAAGDGSKAGEPI